MFESRMNAQYRLQEGSTSNWLRSLKIKKLCDTSSVVKHLTPGRCRRKWTSCTVMSQNHDLLQKVSVSS